MKWWHDIQISYDIFSDHACHHGNHLIYDLKKISNSLIDMTISQHFLDNGLAPIRRQAIVWTSDILV